MPRRLLPIEAFSALVGREAGVSRPFPVPQAMIDGFAALTFDDQFIHVDPERAAREGPFGGTVAHGFLTLSLLSAMAYDALPEPEGSRASVNAGFERVRFVSPVRAGAEIAGRFTLAGLDRPGPGEVRFRWAVTVEILGAAKPALVADWLTRAWGDWPGP